MLVGVRDWDKEMSGGWKFQRRGVVIPIQDGYGGGADAAAGGLFQSLG